MIDSSETVLPGAAPDAARGTGTANSRLARVLRPVAGVLRRNWVLALLLAAGLVLRALAQVGYQPALLFIDSKKYIFGTDLTSTSWGSFDPIGYTLLVLKPGA